MKPHIYLFGGRWWVCSSGRDGSTADRSPRRTFPEACYLAMLAAIYSGVWRA